MKNAFKIILASCAAPFLIPAAAASDKTPAAKIAPVKIDPAMATILNADIRKDDAARDIYRHPAETLAFFQITADQTVAEYGPGGGWFTRILAPYLAGSGKYIAIGADTAPQTFPSRAREAASKGWPERFPAQAAGWTGIDAAKFAAFESDELPPEMLGTVDRIVIFRSLHGMVNNNRADSELRNMHKMLKPGGMIGIEQHRANDDATYDFYNGTKGYLRQRDVIALFELHGFMLAGSSEVNANPKDTKDYPGGVWTLPPTRDSEPENDAKYQAIGESDRMTLLFKKRP